MKFSVGYPINFKGSFYNAVAPYLESIGEVYFSYDGFASGRAVDNSGYNQIFFDDLQKFSKSSIKLNLLLNGSCYGKEALSHGLAFRALDTVEMLKEKYCLSAVTTASPYLAHAIKSAFPNIDLRASVNMWIDGIDGMKQCADLFDSFYAKREYNRRPKEIMRQADWCHDNGKKLYLLANSGCIPNCAFHIFHDTFISHSAEFDETKTDQSFVPYACRRFFEKEENRYMILAGNLVRPEDLHNLEGIVDGVKLATRIHPFPAIIIGAYVKGSFQGDLCTLTEPGFGDMLNPFILDNTAIPKDFWEVTSNCNKNCSDCVYCKDVYNSILKKVTY